MAAGSEVTAGNVSALLLPDQRERVARLLATMAGPGSEARVMVEAMLPFVYPQLRADYWSDPRELSRTLLRKFDGE